MLFSQDLGVVIALREQLRMRNVPLRLEGVLVRIMNNDNEPPALMLLSRPTDEKLVINKCWPKGSQLDTASDLEQCL